MKFVHMEIKEFNDKYDLNLKEQKESSLFYEQLLKSIDDKEDLQYFSASFCNTDVVEDVFDYQDRYKFDLVEIESVYIALY